MEAVNLRAERQQFTKLRIICAQ